MTTRRDKRLGVFTRLLDGTDGRSVCSLAREQFLAGGTAGLRRRMGCPKNITSIPARGGLPSPLVFLAGIAASGRQRPGWPPGSSRSPLSSRCGWRRTPRCLMRCPGAAEPRLRSGGSGFAFTAFGHDPAQRGRLYDEGVAAVLSVLSGEPVEQSWGTRCSRTVGGCWLTDIWQATSSPHVAGIRAGKAGSGFVAVPAPSPAGADRSTRCSQICSSRSSTPTLGGAATRFPAAGGCITLGGGGP